MNKSLKSDDSLSDMNMRGLAPSTNTSMSNIYDEND